MKNIIVLMVLILVTSGCSNFQKATQSEQQTQFVSECPSCKDECRKQCDEEIADAQKPYKHEIDLEEEKCLKNAYSNEDMMNCADEATDAWFLEIDKNLSILKKYYLGKNIH